MALWSRGLKAGQTQFGEALLRDRARRRTGPCFPPGVPWESRYQAATASLARRARRGIRRCERSSVRWRLRHLTVGPPTAWDVPRRPPGSLWGRAAPPAPAAHRADAKSVARAARRGRRERAQRLVEIGEHGPVVRTRKGRLPFAENNVALGPSHKVDGRRRFERERGGVKRHAFGIRGLDLRGRRAGGSKLFVVRRPIDVLFPAIVKTSAVGYVR